MNDDELLAMVGRAVAADQPPVDLIHMAKSSFDWVDLDASLMELVEDSAADELVAVRDVATERMVVFEDASGIIDLMIRGHAPSRIEGRLDTPGVIRFERPDGQVIVAGDGEITEFELDDIQPGPIRLVVERDNMIARTEWITI